MYGQRCRHSWLENLSRQFFCGEQYLRTDLPIDPSSLARWRKRIGEEGVKILLPLTIEAPRAAGLSKRSSIDTVIADTTVMPKAIAHPADSKLLERSSQHLVKLSKDNSVVLRQNYNRQAPRMAVQAGRYAHAKQFNSCAERSKRCAFEWPGCIVKLHAMCQCLQNHGISKAAKCSAMLHAIVRFDSQ